LTFKGREFKVMKQLQAVECIRLMKKNYTYKYLSSLYNIPDTVLCRYVKGMLLPNYEMAKQIVNRTLRYLNDIVRSKIDIDKQGIINTVELMSDVNLLNIIAYMIAEEYIQEGVSKILTTINCVPLATLVAEKIKASLIIAKNLKDVGVKNFIEESYSLVSLPMQATLYVPSNLLSTDDKVLILNDVLRSGRTLKALVNIVRKANAKIAGIYALIAVGSEWKKVVSELQIPKVKILVKVY